MSKEKLPNYSKNEEIFNMSSHIIGGIIGFVFYALSKKKKWLHIVSIKRGEKMTKETFAK